MDKEKYLAIKVKKDLDSVVGLLRKVLRDLQLVIDDTPKFKKTKIKTYEVKNEDETLH